MTHMTDWLMVCITALYLLATIAIFVVNFLSTKAMQNQLMQSKKQFEESQRLQVMPFLQVNIEDRKQGENGELVFPFADYNVSYSWPHEKHFKGYYIFPLEDFMKGWVYISIKNAGLGLIHNTTIDWDLCLFNHERTCEDIIILPNSEWGINVRFLGDPLEEEEIKQHCCGDGNNFLEHNFINIQYDDLLGNRYEQSIDVYLRMSTDHKTIEVIDYSITAPELIDSD